MPSKEEAEKKINFHLGADIR